MRTGDKVSVPVWGGGQANVQIIDIKEDIIVTASDEEIRRCAEAGRLPLGIGRQK